MVKLEKFRPLLHFTPPTAWINDPNGMVYFEGEYHLFYQFYPDDVVWGPMHWGHAVSRDLVNWRHLPIALAPDELGYIFSGSAVIDWENTAVFGHEAMIAAYTYHHPETEAQSQAIAYSQDNGRSWTKYEGNPVIPTPDGVPNFRDPKLFWYQNASGLAHWVMVLAVGHSVEIFTSPDLKAWQFASKFVANQDPAIGVWETPDLFDLSVTDSDESRWVLTVGIGEGAPAGGSGMQYFVGQFDGFTFTNDNAPEAVLWADYGADFYAAQSWSDVPNGRRVWLAWLNNWQYARDIPTSTWRGAMSLPREVSLVKTPNGIRMRQTAVSELQQLRQEKQSWSNLTLSSSYQHLLGSHQNPIEMTAQFAMPTEAKQFGFSLYSNQGDDILFGYDVANRQLFFDRTKSGKIDAFEGFNSCHVAPFEPANDELTVHIYIDCAVIEIFVNDGLVTFAEQIFPKGDTLQLRLFANGGSQTIKQLTLFQLAPALFETE